MLRRSILVLALVFTMLLASSASAFAVTTPSFPSCVNPQGSVKANYDTGSHGIVGSTNDYSGKDTVYAQANGNALQCFCATNGQGIQSNWVKATGYSQEDLSILKNSGWTVVPDGSLWGLENDPYVVKNNEYSCQGSSNSGGGSTSNGSSNSSSVQAVLGAVTLAGTGNVRTIFFILLLGVGTLTSSLVLRKLSK